MNINLIKILSFFIGLFITLVILSYYKINEPFTDQPENKVEDKEEEKENKEEFIPITVNDQSVLPFEGYKFMCINTYLDIGNISLNDGKWYDNYSEKRHYDLNVNNYFKFNQGIELYDNDLNKNGAKLANIKNVQLEGPACFNFANNSETYELTEFSMFLVTKITNFSNNHNILFEMTGNSVTTDKIVPNYTSSIINVDFIVNEKLNYNVNIRVGDIVYTGLIDNIDKDIIHDPYYITLGLYYTSTTIGFIINKKLYEYANKNPYKINLGSTPLIINKYGSINMQLLNFVYYKTLFHFDNFDYFVSYNNFYISGLYYETLNKKCTIDRKVYYDGNLLINSSEEIETPTETNYGEVRHDHDHRNNKLIKLPEFKYDLLERVPTIFNRIFNF
jgi:hypothetical protein